MAATCPVDLDTISLRNEIQSVYARVATEPSGTFHFHRGPAYAASWLEYDAEALSLLPPGVTESFRWRCQSSPYRPRPSWHDGGGHRLRRRHGSVACGPLRRTDGPSHRSTSLKQWLNARASELAL